MDGINSNLKINHLSPVAFDVVIKKGERTLDVEMSQYSLIIPPALYDFLEENSARIYQAYAETFKLEVDELTDEQKEFAKYHAALAQVKDD